MSPYPQKLKISCDQPPEEPNQMKHNYMPVALAPGMSRAIQLELHATVVKTARYEIIILQESMERIVKEIKFFICDPLQYKTISNSLSMANKLPYEDCVTIVGTIASKEEPSLTNKSEPFSTALIGDDEMEEIRTMPLVGSVFWDPQTQQLRIDPELNKVFVEVESSVELSKTKTENNRERRLSELEGIGMITCNAVKQGAALTGETQDNY